MKQSQSLILVEAIERRILMLRGLKVMLGQDLAERYDVAPKVLHQAVKRNIRRFPPDFMFQLNPRRVQPVEVTICDFNTRWNPIDDAPA